MFITFFKIFQKPVINVFFTVIIKYYDIAILRWRFKVIWSAVPILHEDWRVWTPVIFCFLKTFYCLMCYRYVRELDHDPQHLLMCYTIQLLITRIPIHLLIYLFELWCKLQANLLVFKLIGSFVSNWIIKTICLWAS